MLISRGMFLGGAVVITLMCAMLSGCSNVDMGHRPAWMGVQTGTAPRPNISPADERAAGQVIAANANALREPITPQIYPVRPIDPSRLSDCTSQTAKKYSISIDQAKPVCECMNEAITTRVSAEDMAKMSGGGPSKMSDEEGLRIYKLMAPVLVRIDQLCKIPRS